MTSPPDRGASSGSKTGAGRQRDDGPGRASEGRNQAGGARDLPHRRDHHSDGAGRRGHCRRGVGGLLGGPNEATSVRARSVSTGGTPGKERKAAHHGAQGRVSGTAAASSQGRRRAARACGSNSPGRRAGAVGALRPVGPKRGRETGRQTGARPQGPGGPAQRARGARRAERRVEEAGSARSQQTTRSRAVSGERVRGARGRGRGPEGEEEPSPVRAFGGWGSCSTPTPTKRASSPGDVAAAAGSARSGRTVPPIGAATTGPAQQVAARGAPGLAGGRGSPARGAEQGDWKRPGPSGESAPQTEAPGGRRDVQDGGLSSLLFSYLMRPGKTGRPPRGEDSDMC